MRISDWSSDVCSSDLLTREWAGKQSLKVTIDCETAIGVIEADERRLKQALYNLVSNAIKFTPPGGRITLSARREDQQVSLTVSDKIGRASCRERVCQYV